MSDSPTQKAGWQHITPPNASVRTLMRRAVRGGRKGHRALIRLRDQSFLCRDIRLADLRAIIVQDGYADL